MSLPKNVKQLTLDEKRRLARELLERRTRGAGDVAPLSCGQQALWFLYEMSPESAAYNFAYAARLQIDLDVAAMGRACQQVVDHHPALRTTYETRPGGSVQKIHSQQTVPVRLVEATGWDEETLRTELEAEADRPFDLRHGPVLRATLYRRGRRDYVLQLIAHHIAADLWSMDLLVRELRDRYLADVRGQALEVDPPSARFTDFVRWESDLLESPRADRLWNYWQARLAGELPVLDVPTDHARPRVQTFQGASWEWKLDPASCEGLRRLAREERVTLFTTLLAAFEVALHRWSSQEQFLVGTVTASRSRPEWEQVVGYFLNQVPLRADFSGDPSFSTLLKRVRDDVFGALEHQDFPLATLVEKLQPRRDPGRTPLFQVMFIWDKPRALDDGPTPHAMDSRARRAGTSAGEFSPETIMMEQRGAPFDLTLIVFEIGDELSLTIRYNVALFDPETIQRMAGHLNTLIAGLLANPRMPVSRLPLVTDAERHTLLVEHNDTAVPLDRKACIHQLIEMQACQTPQAEALAFEGGSLTYSEFDRLANQLANRLLALGVARGDMVGMALPRGWEAIVSILAIWKAGGVYVPLDPSYPKGRLAYMIEDARPKVVLAGGSAASELAASGAKVISLDAEWDRIDTESEEPPHVTIKPSDPAYVIYTSGSTGRPKGVLLRHQGLVNLVEINRRMTPAEPGSRVLQFASLSFDASIHEIAQALPNGGTLVLAGTGNQCTLPGAGLVQLLRDQRVTMATLPPSVLAATAADHLPALTTVISAGEPCTAEIVDRWAPGRRFVNAYGPTEATVWVSSMVCRAGQGAPSIGFPMANTKLYVLDKQLEPMPIGVPGELHIATPGLAMGYLNQPELTADRFIPNPFSDAYGATLYKTGDWVRRLADGQLEFLGRIDHQLKLRGFRIELGEIEAVLAAHPDVRQAVVIARDEPGGPPRLVAYVVPQEGRSPSVGQLRGTIKEHLPDYMIPAAFVTLDALPLTANGKVDRRRLPAPSDARPDLEREYVAPRNETERKLAEICAAVLKLDRVGIHDNFFDLGGASIQTLQVVERAAAAQITLKPELLFQYQTIAELAARCLTPESKPASEPPAAKVAPGRQSATAAKSKPRSSAAASAAPAAQKARPTAAAPEPPATARDSTGLGQMIIESLGVHLPAGVLTTTDVIRGCKVPLEFPLERMTGIVSRRVVQDGEYSIDLARRAVRQCLRRSRHSASEIELLVCCNISRCDGPDFHFSCEPSTAARLAKEFSFTRALAFDITNACAGFFTALSIVESMLKVGAVRTAMVVSGEHITHLTRTAQYEIEGFMDPRLACLTLGDSGVAMLLERSAKPGVGFHDLDLYTLGRYSELCVAKASDRSHLGAIMLTDPVQATAVTVEQCVKHALHTLTNRGWTEQDVHHVVLHQTSETTLDGAMQELNRAYGRGVCHRGNTIFDIAERGNTATNTHWVAVMDNILNGNIQTGANIAFGISGSGQTTGTALYTMDDLPDRIRHEQQPGSRAADAELPPAAPVSTGRIRVSSVGISPDSGEMAADSLAMLEAAGEECLRGGNRDRREVGLVIHSGIYRNDFLSEPAVAAMAAGRLRINDHIDSPDEQKTLAFDLMNGATGTLDACYVAARMMEAGRANVALLLAAEIENNANVWPENLLGLEETASAMLLELDETGRQGFGRFVFETRTEHVDAIESHSARHNDLPALAHRRVPNVEARWLEMVPRVAEAALAAEGLDLEDIRVILPPQVSASFVAQLANVLGVASDRVLDLTDRVSDLFTSSVAYNFREVAERRLARSGDVGLVIGVGSGLHVGCAVYYF